MAYNKDNIFAKIIRGEIESDIIYQDEYVIAFNDKYPVAPVHILIIPKGEYESFDDFAGNASDIMIINFFKSIKKIAKLAGVENYGYRLISNHKENAGQSVFHFHFHLIAGKALTKLI